MINLSTEYLGIKLKNPVVVGSCGLTDTPDKVLAAANAGAGAVVLKSLFEEEIIAEMDEQFDEMNRPSAVFPENYAFWDESDKQDLIREYLDLIRKSKERVDIPVIASVNCVSAQKWTYLAAEIEKAGADALELNIFLLPSDINRSAEEYRNQIIEIIQKVRSETKLPLSVKLSNYSSELSKLIADLSKMGVEGFTLFNRSYSPDFDIEKMTLTAGNVLSHPGDVALPLRWSALLSSKIESDIAASTGVHTGEDLVKVLLAGSTCAHVVSALYRKGVEEIALILNFLKDWMARHGYQSIIEFKGAMALDETKEAADYERVQFYRTFRTFEI
ncbi:dihydroorotate dehydrogenase-like protein [Prolixibacteraceae bacterium JC049]|jgi:dihydroorotate dehydrogenase (fumarate)|nr:dihydroorotate dehydrogenase-like protein [Prolixibacteraceae bacterium JC049]